MKIFPYVLYIFLIVLYIPHTAAAKDEVESEPVYERPPMVDEDFLSSLQSEENTPEKELTPDTVTATEKSNKAPDIELPPLPLPLPVAEKEKETTTEIPSPTDSTNNLDIPGLPSLTAPAPIPTPILPAATPLPPTPKVDEAREDTKESAKLDKKEEPIAISHEKTPLLPPAVQLTLPDEDSPQPLTQEPFSVYDSNATENKETPPTVEADTTKPPVIAPPAPAAESTKAEEVTIEEPPQKETKVLSKEERQRLKEKSEYDIRQRQRALDRAIAADKMWQQDALNYKIQTLPNELYNSPNAENSHIAKPLTPSDYKQLLFDAVANGDANTTRAILNNTNTLNIKGEEGNTPLISATAHEKTEVVRLLLGKQVYVDATNNNKATALHIASYLGNVEIARALLSMLANPNFHDNSGKTPLHYAVNNGNIALIKMLISSNANPNLTDNNHMTALDYALIKGNKSVLSALLKTKLDTITLNKNLLLAVSLNQLDAVTTLLSKGANVNFKDSNGRTPLMNASLRGDDQLTDLLLTKGANVNLTDHDGKKASYLAEMQGFFSIAEILYAEESSHTSSIGTATPFSSTYQPITNNNKPSVKKQQSSLKHNN